MILKYFYSNYKIIVLFQLKSIKNFTQLIYVLFNF